MRYSELLCKTNYSFLRGASHPEECVAQAAVQGLYAIGICDRNGVYGIPKAYQESKKHPKLKLLVGAELLCEKRAPVQFLARTRAAYGLLCRVITTAHAGKEKGQAVLNWSELLALCDAFSAGAGDLLVFSDTEEGAGDLKDIFGANFYLPLFRGLDGKDKYRTERAKRIVARFGIQIVATNDVHYHVQSRSVLQDVVAGIRDSVPLDSAGKKLFSNAERYLKTPAQMAKLFSDMPDAVERTAEIADQFSFSMAELRFRYPSEWIPAGQTAQHYLTTLVWTGACSRYHGNIPVEVERQIAHELQLVEQLQFADYFLTIWDIVEFARGRKILCQGRGSAANSILCYCLGITAIDPVRMNLLFERFISVERGEPPDIDVDFEHERREEVLQYVYEKYGRHRAAMVAAVITYRTRSSLREVSKTLGLDLDRVKSEEDDFPKKQLARQLAQELKGFPRHLSIHSGGFTLSQDPIIETVPVEPARMEGRTIVQWDKYDLDIVGLLKVDLLSLGMLSAIQKTCELVGLEYSKIPAEDPATYQMIQRADTVGVFQIESRAQMNMLGRLQPESFYDLVIEVAIVRPGPIVGRMVHPYLRRRRGLENPKSPDPRLEPILGRTLGVPLFQEQVMKMAIVMAGFTPGEADELRRAIGAWRSSGSIEKMGQKLRDGFLKNGLPSEFVDRVFEQIKGFAEYGFPESHAASFALIAYASSYLKCHYPAEFLCSLLNSLPMGFYSEHTLVEDAKRHGVKVLPIDVNGSDWDCRIESGELRLGFRLVKGMARKVFDRLFNERSERPFAGIGDFIARAKPSLRILESLALGGVFEPFKVSEREALWEALAYDCLLRAELGQSQGQQLSLFSQSGLSGLLREQSAPQLVGLDDFERVSAQFHSFRLSLGEHPMPVLRRFLRQVPRAVTADAKKGRHGQRFRVAGMVIVRQRPPTAKGTVFSALEDETGLLDLIFHKAVHEKYQKTLSSNAFLVASGELQKDGYSVSLLVSKIEPLMPPETEQTLNFKTHDWH
ncbi:MAG TPA: error-prone DNA polymerase [Oligoflexia bacterium]|nr:error-prone DNA polymerase [Oligoflexia bacterium]